LITLPVKELRGLQNTYQIKVKIFLENNRNFVMGDQFNTMLQRKEEKSQVLKPINKEIFVVLSGVKAQTDNL